MEMVESAPGLFSLVVSPVEPRAPQSIDEANGSFPF